MVGDGVLVAAGATPDEVTPTRPRPTGMEPQWEKRAEHHLLHIDASNPSLSMALSSYHHKQKRPAEAIEWADRALQIPGLKTQEASWLHKVRTLSAQTLWHQHREDSPPDDGSQPATEAARYQELTIEYAQEWLGFAQAHELDFAAPLELCTEVASADDCMP